MLKRRLRRLLPSTHGIGSHRMVRWLGPALSHPQVWHVSRRGIALGLAIGIFFSLLVPVAHIVLAAAAAVLLRANLPVAVLSTFVNNPFTFAPLYYLAYRIGAMLLGEPASEAVVQSLDEHATGMAGWLDLWSDRLLTWGKPLLLGLVVMASSGALLAYLLVDGLWRVLTLWAWRRRRQRRDARG
jgi:uncharacterized protein (DUF2062 family)